MCTNIGVTLVKMCAYILGNYRNFRYISVHIHLLKIYCMKILFKQLLNSI